jgi:hypothetical protein
MVFLPTRIEIDFLVSLTAHLTHLQNVSDPINSPFASKSALLASPIPTLYSGVLDFIDPLYPQNPEFSRPPGSPRTSSLPRVNTDSIHRREVDFPLPHFIIS